jgi:HK97 family phage prohead protease
VYRKAAAKPVVKQDVVLVGYPVRYDVPSDMLAPGFKEVIARGAFTESLANDQQFAFVSHDRKLVLGRTSSNLQLAEDQRGVWMRLTLPATTLGRDTGELVRKGIYREMSFAFTIEPGGESWSVDDGVDVRHVTRAKLFEVSIVDLPAYSQTSVMIGRNNVGGYPLELAKQTMTQASAKAVHSLSMPRTHNTPRPLSLAKARLQLMETTL